MNIFIISLVIWWFIFAKLSTMNKCCSDVCICKTLHNSEKLKESVARKDRIGRFRLIQLCFAPLAIAMIY